MNSLSYDELLLPFQRGCKPVSDYKLGIELENFVVRKDNGKHVGYEDGVKELLLQLSKKYSHWSPIYEGDNVIGLVSSYGNISLEPSAAVEFSSKQQRNVEQLEQDISRFYHEFSSITETLGFEILYTGFQPNELPQNLNLIPKSRYKMMYDYMPQVGSRGIEMMKLTASTQICIDFSSEEDAMRKLVLAAKLTPYFVAISANSRTAYGKDSGHASHRSYTWLDTDNSRCGYPDLVFLKNPKFEDYVNWALEVPVYFMEREHQKLQLTQFTFRQLMENGFEFPQIAARQFPNLADWEAHLGTLFPWVRLRNYIEFRAFDLNPPQLVKEQLRIVNGIFYSQAALTKVEALVESFDKPFVDGLLFAAINDGIEGEFGGVDFDKFNENIMALI